MVDKDNGKTIEEGSDNPSNPGPNEVALAVMQVQLSNVIMMVSQIEKDIRDLTKHTAVCAERWRQHAEEHKSLQNSSRMSDAGIFAWSGVAAAISYFLGR